jgi:hypothetical protein
VSWTFPGGESTVEVGDAGESAVEEISRDTCAADAVSAINHNGPIGRQLFEPAGHGVHGNVNGAGNETAGAEFAEFPHVEEKRRIGGGEAFTQVGRCNFGRSITSSGSRFNSFGSLGAGKSGSRMETEV